MRRTTTGRRLLCAALLLAPVAPLPGCMPAEEGPVVGQRQPLRGPRAERAIEHLLRRTAGQDVGAAEDFQVLREFSDEQGMHHVHLRQTLGGIPVWGGEGIVHSGADGGLFALTDTLRRRCRVEERVPQLPPGRARELAQELRGCSRCRDVAEPDLWVLRDRGQDRLVYRVQLSQGLAPGDADPPARPVSFIDAQSGEEVWGYDDLQSLTGSGASLYSGTVALETSASGGTYHLEDLSRKVGTFDLNGSTDTAGGARLPDADNVWDSAVQRAGVDAHYGLARTYDYFLGVHGRNGLNGIGGPGPLSAAANPAIALTSAKVHYGTNVNNAYSSSDSGYMYFGDGDGVASTPWVSLDMVGHEWTHGVTYFSAGLIYADESGALNESMSDVFGLLVKRHVRGGAAAWTIGEDLWTPAVSGDALRYLYNPHLKERATPYTPDDDPDHYGERYLGTLDNGGVHVNSGIANHAFYLLAQGGTHHLGGSMTGIGVEDAARIWYKALTTYMTASTNFVGARLGTLNAAAAIFGAGSAQQQAVANAWTLVGVLADYSLSANPVTQAVVAGQSASYAVTASSLGGFSDPVTLSVSGLPAGASASFAASPLTPTASTTLTIATAGTTPLGGYTLALGGVSGTLVRSVPLILGVTSASNPVVNGGFESGTTAGWAAAGTTSLSSAARSGGLAGQAGSTSAPAGDHSLAQTFTVPAGATTLAFYYKVVCTDAVKRDWAAAMVRNNTTGQTTTVLGKTCSSNNTWRQASYNLAGRAGQSLTLTLTTHSDGNTLPTYTLWDDVAIQ